MITLRQQIKEMAAEADLTPQAVTLLQNFFLDMATSEEKKALDEWLHASEANDQFFDLLLEINFEGTGAGTIHLLTKLAKKQPFKISRFWKIVIGIVVLFLLDHFIWPHPISWLLSGGKEIRTTPLQIKVQTGDQARTFWMPDSTRVELLPYSTFIYPEWFRFAHKVELKGSARFDVRASIRPLHVRSGEVWLEIPYGTVTILSDSGKLVVQQLKQ
jgi:ferric-dicitrate binding protein FerR (iron transport regulator)